MVRGKKYTAKETKIKEILGLHTQACILQVAAANRYLGTIAQKALKRVKMLTVQMASIYLIEVTVNYILKP